MNSPLSTDSLNHLWDSDFAVFLKGVHHQTVAADVVDTLRKEVEAKKGMKSVCKFKSKQVSTMFAVGKFLFLQPVKRAPHVISAAAFLNAENYLKLNCRYHCLQNTHLADITRPC